MPKIFSRMNLAERDSTAWIMNAEVMILPDHTYMHTRAKLGGKLCICYVMCPAETELTGLNSKKTDNESMITALVVASWGKEEEMKDLMSEERILELNNCTCDSKTAVWLKLVVDLGKDPWGIVYKTVIKKLYNV